MRLVAKMEGDLGWNVGGFCWLVQFWVQFREFLTIWGICTVGDRLLAVLIYINVYIIYRYRC